MQRDVEALGLLEVCVPVLITTSFVVMTCIWSVRYFREKAPRQPPAEPQVEFSSNEDCAICLSNITQPCLTQCGHSFCCRCIISYWNSCGRFRRIRCPCCRSPVNIIIPQSGQANAARSEVNEYNYSFGKGVAESLRERLNMCLPLLRMFGIDLLADPFRCLATLLTVSIQMKNIIFLGACVGYIISPVDLIPEVQLNGL